MVSKGSKYAIEVGMPFLRLTISVGREKFREKFHGILFSFLNKRNEETVHESRSFYIHCVRRRNFGIYCSLVLIQLNWIVLIDKKNDEP